MNNSKSGLIALHTGNFAIALSVILFLCLRLAGKDIPGVTWIAVLALHFVINFDRMTKLVRTFFLIAATALAAEWTLSSGPSHDAINRTASFFGFIIIVGFFTSRAQNSATIASLLDNLKSAQGLRKYLLLNIQTYCLGLIINVGSVYLLAPLAISRGSEPEIRRQSLAIIRGFAATCLWSPLSMSPLLVLSLVDNVKYINLVAGGFVIASGMLTLGYLLERRAIESEAPGENANTTFEKSALVLFASLIAGVAGVSTVAR